MSDCVPSRRRIHVGAVTAAPCLVGMFNGWCLHAAVPLQLIAGEVVPVRHLAGTKPRDNLKLTEVTAQQPRRAASASVLPEAAQSNSTLGVGKPRHRRQTRAHRQRSHANLGCLGGGMGLRFFRRVVATISSLAAQQGRGKKAEEEDCEKARKGRFLAVPEH